ncbi:nucleoside triphosphate pyrophosphohydrolase [Streptomyces sp. SID13031]|uniref:nucleoside triphosphate pyrophosphohydrolase n=1 Tax=Streptomyces sp. SID13031 TaxID=2706046 RepID=UPI001945B3C7|nr:nucleoside triphosphate pyrophosphohydrolase [Streptomyces sp. SID13031]
MLIIPSWKSLGDATSAGEQFATVDEAFTNQVLTPVSEFFGDVEILVRSSADSEDLSERGRYTSMASPTSPAAVRAAMSSVYQSAIEAGESPASMALLLQPRIDALMSGHLSNEHRISRTAWNWTLQEQVGSEVNERQLGVSGSSRSSDGPLLCPNLTSLDVRLREVCRRLSSNPHRYHLEWVWDGSRLWIVQADRVIPLTAPPPGEQWTPRTGVQIGPKDLTIWSVVDIQSGSGHKPPQPSVWPKIRNVQEFAQAGLPVPRLFLLEDAGSIQELADGHVSPALLEDIRLLTTGDVIVRTDVRTADRAQLFLPKTDNVADVEQLCDFLVRTTRKLLHSRVTVGEIGFIAHRYLRARACAWAYARPGHSVVQIDSTWGLVDGLNWCAHDSSSVNVSTGDIRRQVIAKPTFIDVASDRSWASRETPTEWIWRSSISEGQLRTVAEGARALADLREEAIATMWFISILDGADADCLPWFSTPYEISPEATILSVGKNAPRYKAPNLADLRALAEINPPAGSILRVHPDGDLARNEEFIQVLGDLAISRGYIVEIEGSPLAHPYYILRRRGVSVLCVGRDTTTGNSAQHNKLVRDNIPDIIAASGEVAVTYQAGQLERENLLRAKVVEEALELLRSTAIDDSLGELADLIEVLRTLQATLGISDADLEEAVDRKRSRRGGFDESVVLVRTSPFPERPSAQTSETQTPVLPGLEDIAEPSQSTPVREEAGRLLLNYVPPPPGRPQVWRMNLRDITILLTYEKDAIALEILDAGRRDLDSSQYPLPGI